MSMEGFMDCYGNRHSQRAEKMGARPRLPDAQRYVPRYVTPLPDPLTGEVIHKGCDCVIDIRWNTREDLEAATKDLADPATRDIRKADELRLFESNRNPVTIVGEHVSPVGPDDRIPDCDPRFG